MTVKRALLIIESLLCVIVAAMLIIGAMSIYTSGLALRNADPFADIYTVEAIKKAVTPVIPAFAALVITTIASVVMGVRDESADKLSKIEAGKDLSEKAKESKSLKTIRCIILCLAVLLMIIGMINGSIGDVFIKASNICSE